MKTAIGLWGVVSAKQKQCLLTVSSVSSDTAVSVAEKFFGSRQSGKKECRLGIPIQFVKKWIVIALAMEFVLAPHSSCLRPHMARECVSVNDVLCDLPSTNGGSQFSVITALL